MALLLSQSEMNILSLRRKIRILISDMCVLCSVSHTYHRALNSRCVMLFRNAKWDAADANLHINWSKNRDKTPKTRQNHYHLLRCSVISLGILARSFAHPLPFPSSSHPHSQYNFIHSILTLSYHVLHRPHKSFHLYVLCFLFITLSSSEEQTSFLNRCENDFPRQCQFARSRFGFALWLFFCSCSACCSKSAINEWMRNFEQHNKCEKI